MPDGPVRVVDFLPRTVFRVVGILIATAVVLEVVWIARHVLTWIFIALFLALALNPAVDRLEGRIKRRGLATAVIYLMALGATVGVALLFIPTLVHQVNDFAGKVPDYLNDVTKGRGRLGFLQTKYHLVDKAREALNNGGASKLFGVSGTALALAKGIVNVVLATVTIAFMTFFMLLEGEAWKDRFIALLPAKAQPRAQHMASEIARTIGGYVSGNLFISVIAGFSVTIVLLVAGVPFALALGLLVAILDLIPLAGATLGAIIVTLVALTHSLTAALIVLAFFIVYQQLENHLLQPIVYGRTVQLSPLAILVSVLVGAEVAGVIGALGAIPVAGTIQIVISDWLQHRRPPPPEDGVPDTALELPPSAEAALRADAP